MRSRLFGVTFITCFLLLSSGSLIAQESRNPGATLSGQISGQVRYAQGGQPVFNVMVSCDSFTGGLVGQVFTDRNGRFQFRNLAPSQYNITVRVPGYFEERQTVELLTNPSAYLQFQLRPDETKVVSFMSPVDANVPAAAKKEYDQAAAGLASGKKEGLEDAVQHLEKALAIYPKFVQAELMLGTAYMDLGQWDKAEQSLKRTIADDPKAANALLALGELYLKQKKHEEAEKNLLQGVQLAANSPNGHLSLARLYWDMAANAKDEATARPLLEKSYGEVNKALELNPKFGHAHIVKGNLLLRVRRATDAQHEFEEYLRLEPKGPFAEQARATVEKIKKALAAQPKS